MKYLLGVVDFYLNWSMVATYWVGCKWDAIKARFGRKAPVDAQSVEVALVAIEPRVPKANEAIIEYRKNGHSYYFIFTPENTEGAMRSVGVLAADPQCEFDWHDTAKVAKAIKGACCEQVHVSV